MESDKQYNILVTGGNGFIGWNFINYLNKQTKLNINQIINVDANFYSAINSTEQIANCKTFNMKMSQFSEFFLEHFDIDIVVNFAAHTHVDNSIKSIKPFLENNVVEMGVLMENCSTYWKKTKKTDVLFVQVSTDEVFGSVEDQDGIAFNEFQHYHANNPYAASKASAEMLLNSFIHTHDFPALITNCSNNYGAGQHEEKLIPKIIKNCKKGLDIPIYGDGLQKRDWIYVDDHCEGIVKAILYGHLGDSYLFGTNSVVTNLELTNRLCQIMNEKYPEKHENLITFVTDRAGHDRLYRIDYTKAYVDLNWYPKTDLNDGLQKTVDWYINKSL